jgi:hypothetical protein
MRKVLPVVFLSMLFVVFEASADAHRSTGLVLRVNSADGVVDLLENGQQVELIVVQGTALIDDQGKRLQTLGALQIGDYVREECNRRNNGPSIARNISVLIPAWRMLESPEH